MYCMISLGIIQQKKGITVLIKIRTWNLNYWKKRYSRYRKSKEERTKWINTGKNIIEKEIEKDNDEKNDTIRFWMLQEANLIIY